MTTFENRLNMLCQASVVISDVEHLFLWIGIAILAVMVGILGWLVYRSRNRSTNVPSADELRSRLAQVVTIWAMTAIVLLGITILVHYICDLYSNNMIVLLHDNWSDHTGAARAA
jgi:cytochrome b561